MDIVSKEFANKMVGFPLPKNIVGRHFYSVDGILYRCTGRRQNWKDIYLEVGTGRETTFDSHIDIMFFAPESVEILAQMPGYSLIFLDDGKLKWGCYGLGTLFNSADGGQVEMSETPADACAKAWIKLNKQWN